jgi:hypothetical protein
MTQPFFFKKQCFIFDVIELLNYLTLFDVNINLTFIFAF